MRARSTTLDAAIPAPSGRRDKRAPRRSFVDRIAAKVMGRVFLAGRRRQHVQLPPTQLRAFQLYADPALLRSPETAFPEPTGVTEPAMRRILRGIKAGRVEKIELASDHRTFDPERQAAYDRYAENRTVHVRAFLHDRPHPAVVCLHSWLGGRYWVDAWMLEARLLHDRGLDVYLMTMPFHGERTPGLRLGGIHFPSPSIARTAEGFRQAVWDARLVRALALASGAPSVGVIGMSLGGCTAALLASLDTRWSFAIPVAPLVSLGDAIWDLAEGHRERRLAEQQGLTRAILRTAFALHSPLSHSLRLPKGQVAIVAGRGDGICPPASVELLWRHWDHPHLSWFAGGHLFQHGRAAAMRQALKAVGF